MSYSAIVTKVENVRTHSNADRVKLATCCGNQVVVDLDVQEGDICVYFSCDGQLSHEFCYHNNLYRDSSKNINKDAKPGMFDDNRRVRVQKFRGEISDGFAVPLSYFSYIRNSEKVLLNGFEFCTLNGNEICNKYVTKETYKTASLHIKGVKVAKKSVMFKEHFDTGQYGRNRHVFTSKQYIIITEKLHGTSSRIGYVRVEKRLNWKERFARALGINVSEYEWKYLNGTRRVVIEESTGTQYHDPSIREYAFYLFKNKLRKGETVFCEIVGFDTNNLPIMHPVKTDKLNDKTFTETYGEKMCFSYGCEPGKCDVYVYRMTMTNKEGYSVDYCWDDVVKRCNEIGVKHVPELKRITMEEIKESLRFENENPSEYDLQAKLTDIIEELVKGPSTVDNRHIREGVCIRIEGGLNNLTYKHKSFEFKVLEDIIKQSGVIDQEEVEDLRKNDEL